MPAKELEPVCRKHGQADQSKAEPEPLLVHNEAPERGRDHHDHEHQAQHRRALPRDDKQRGHARGDHVRGPFAVHDRPDQGWDHARVGCGQGAEQVDGVEVEHDGGEASVEGGEDLVESGVVEGGGESGEDGEGDGEVGRVNLGCGPAEGRVKVEEQRQGEARRGDCAVEFRYVSIRERGTSETRGRLIAKDIGCVRERKVEKYREVGLSLERDVRRKGTQIFHKGVATLFFFFFFAVLLSIRREQEETN